MGIGAHHDDLELMAYDGILRCFGQKNRSFFGITVTDGRNSPRSGIYRDFSDVEIKKVRREEQKKAAIMGKYSGIAMLDYQSLDVKNPNNDGPKKDIKELILQIKPSIVYTHNPADKHDTHVAVMLRTIQALRELPDNQKPEAVYGCELWRDLDWMVDTDKVVFDVSEYKDKYKDLALSLIGIFNSQICGGKQYDQATMGRRKAHATYTSPHNIDIAQYVILGIDLTPLIKNPDQSITDYITGYIERFRADVIDRLTKLS